jgi:predicted RNA-binding protein with PUA-like domain
MNYWLVKSEPSTYSWQQLVKDKRTFWDGVRNFAARNHLRAMQKNDLVFFYHSNEGMEIVGIAKVVKTAYQDPTSDDPNWVAVDLAPFKPMKKAVTLAQIKAEPTLKQLPLVRIPRLSVMPVQQSEFDTLLKLGS